MVHRPVVFTIHEDESLLDKVRKSAEAVEADCRHFDSVTDFLSVGPDVQGCLICSHRLKESSAVELLEAMRARGYCLPMVIITRGAEMRTVVQAMQRGVFTVMDESYSNDELWDTIRRAIDLDRDHRRSTAAYIEIDRRLGSLKGKEKEVLELIIEGHANKVIANRLGVSVRTVESRRHTIFKNTGTKSLAELVALVYRHELCRRVLLGQAGYRNQPLYPLVALYGDRDASLDQSTPAPSAAAGHGRFRARFLPQEPAASATQPGVPVGR